MSKKTNKAKIDELKNSLFDRYQKEETQEKADAKAAELSSIAYDIVRIPNKGNTFEIVKLKYDLETRQAVVDSKVLLDQKVVGLSFLENDKRSIEACFNRLTRNKEA